MKRSQHGFSMMGFLGFLIVFGIVATLGMKIFPMYREYGAVKAAFKGLSADSSVARNPAAIRESLNKRFDVGYIDADLLKSVQIDASSGQPTVKLEYDRESPLAGPFALVGHFKVEQPLGGNHAPE